MYKFTKGKEIEELGNLLKYKRIDHVCLSGFMTPVKCRYIDGKFFHSSMDRYPVSCIIWDLTAELVKEQKEEKMEKMEKIVVRDWVDIKKYHLSSNIVEEKDRWEFKDVEFYGGLDLETTVKIFNALGGNFEYKAVEVIDTLEKWEEFQERMCRFSYIYDRVLGVFIELRADNEDESFVELIEGSVSVKKIEQKYNVDLKILKK